MPVNCHVWPASENLWLLVVWLIDTSVWLTCDKTSLCQKSLMGGLFTNNRTIRITHVNVRDKEVVMHTTPCWTLWPTTMLTWQVYACTVLLPWSQNDLLSTVHVRWLSAFTVDWAQTRSLVISICYHIVHCCHWGTSPLPIWVQILNSLLSDIVLVPSCSIIINSGAVTPAFNIGKFLNECSFFWSFSCNFSRKSMDSFLFLARCATPNRASQRKPGNNDKTRPKSFYQKTSNQWGI